MAKDKHLLPREIKWPSRRVFVKGLHTETIYPNIDSRCCFGELRLGRLNKIYSLWRTAMRSCTPRLGSVWRLLPGQSCVASRDDELHRCCPDRNAGWARHHLPRQQRSFPACVVRLSRSLYFRPACCRRSHNLGLLLHFVCNWVVSTRYRKKRFQNITEHSR